MDTIQTQLDNLAELSDDQVTELQSAVIAEFETVEAGDPTPQSVDAMTQLADMLDTVRGEVQRREAQAEELSAKAAELSARVKGEAAAELSAPEEDEDEAESDKDEEDSEKKDGKPFAAEEEVATVTEEVFSADSTEAVEVPAEASEAATEEVVADVAEGSEAAAEEDTATEVEAPAEAAVEEVSETPVEAEAAVEEAVVEVETPDAEASNSEDNTIELSAQEEAPVTAEVEAEFSAPADRRPVAKVTEAPVAITAGADIPGYSAGSTIDDMNGVAAAMVKRLDTIRRVNGGDGEQHIVASVNTLLPESRQLGGDAEGNWTKIQEVAGPKALQASGGWATPVETRYDVFGLGTDSRPVRDSLPRFQADRGGISVITPPMLADYANAVGVWTAANDISPSAPATKASLTVTGGTFTTYQTDAITLQLKVGNMFSRAYPELLARHIELAQINHSRLAEQTIVAKIDAGSTQVTTTQVLGVARDFLIQIKKAGAAYRSRHRISVDTQLRAIIPTWVLNAMSADLTAQMPGDESIGKSDAEVSAYLASSNITVTESPDISLFPAQSAGGLTPFPASFEWYLFAEGTWLFLDGGSLDIGVIRDSGLVGTNDYRMFLETFEGVAKIGSESLAITTNVKITGTAAALVNTTAGI